MKDFAQTIGDRIRYFRTMKNMTQDELADLAEIHDTYIGKIERGDKNVSAIKLDRILDALDISYMEFFEPFDVKRKGSSTAAECYDLICEQPASQQKRILHVIREVLSIADHSR